MRLALPRQNSTSDPGWLSAATKHDALRHEISSKSMKLLSRGQKSTLVSFGLESPEGAVSVSVALDLAGQPEVDVCCFGLDEQGRLADERYFVFYNQPQSPCGAIMAQGASGGQRQVFKLDLSKLPATIKRLVFSATVDGAAAMRQITRGIVQLSATGTPYAEFHLQGTDYADEKALMLAELYWKDGWRFAATGQGFAAGLPGLLKHFGGEVAEDLKPQANPPAVPPPPPPPPPPVPVPAAVPISLKKLTLDKPGERKSISLEKVASQGTIHLNLNWDRVAKKGLLFGGGKEADLDLGCLYLARDGKKGCIQALGNSFGNRNGEPYIYLDKDDRSGAATDGENLYICRPDLVEKVLVFAFIYEGVANFSTVNARLTLHERDGSETLIRLDAPGPGATFCAICLITRTASGIDIVKETRYFKGHPDADRHYGFGFNWTKGSK
jgi:tellurite resistance protein TerA